MAAVVKVIVSFFAVLLRGMLGTLPDFIASKLYDVRVPPRHLRLLAPACAACLLARPHRRLTPSAAVARTRRPFCT